MNPFWATAIWDRNDTLVAFPELLKQNKSSMMTFPMSFIDGPKQRQRARHRRAPQCQLCSQCQRRRAKPRFWAFLVDRYHKTCRVGWIIVVIVVYVFHHVLTQSYPIQFLPIPSPYQLVNHDAQWSGKGDARALATCQKRCTSAKRDKLRPRWKTAPKKYALVI